MESPATETSRDALLEAGLRCFARYGYEAASLRLVASLAGVEAAAVTRHFEAKADLHRAVVERCLDRCPPCPELPDAVPEARLHAVLRWFACDLRAALAADPPRGALALQALAHALAAPPPDPAPLAQTRLDDGARRLAAAVAGLRPDLPPADLTDWALTLLGACLGPAILGGRLLSGAPGTAGDPAGRAERLAQFAVGGLRSLPGPPAGSQ